MGVRPPPPRPVHGSPPTPPDVEFYIHADDLGATPSITARLLDAWQHRLVDSLSVFGNCDHAEAITVKLRSMPMLPVRIAAHLNLWEGRPLTAVTAPVRLIDRSGHFDTRFLALVRRCHLEGGARQRAMLVDAIEREWRAQIEHVIGMIGSRPLAALDGHIHVHMVPFLFRLAVKLAADYRIPEIRNVREPFYLSPAVGEWMTSRFLVNCVKREVLNRFSTGNAVTSARAGLRSPDRVLGVLYGGMMSRANIAAGIAAARRSGARRVEVLVHIGRAERSEIGRWNGRVGRAAFVLSPSRDAEYRELISLRSTAAALPPERLAS